jgi:hypothetical protein
MRRYNAPPPVADGVLIGGSFKGYGGWGKLVKLVLASCNLGAIIVLLSRGP